MKAFTLMKMYLKNFQESIREIKEAQLNGGRGTVAINGKPTK